VKAKTDGKDDKAKKSTFWTDFGMSFLSAAISKTAVAPVDRVKLLLQCQGELLKQGRLIHPYTGIWDCAYRVYKSEGILSFWRGNVLDIIRFAPTQLVNVFISPSFKFDTRGDSRSLALVKNVASGACTGAISLLMVYHLDYARERMACDIIREVAGQTSFVADRQFDGIPGVYAKTMETEGISGFYTGFGLSVLGVVAYRGLYFGLYDAFVPKNHSGFFARFAVGYLVTIAAGLISYPIDTVRRRLDLGSCARNDLQYDGAWDCAEQIAAKEGFAAFWDGAGANVLRGLGGALMLCLYDTVMSPGPR
jgi:solute carrier family 25 (adenine nucleotide translocator) protein 4/5/6/31